MMDTGRTVDDEHSSKDANKCLASHARQESVCTEIVVDSGRDHLVFSFLGVQSHLVFWFL